jgi:hypothetical protein
MEKHLPNQSELLDNNVPPNNSSCENHCFSLPAGTQLSVFGKPDFFFLKSLAVSK